MGGNLFYGHEIHPTQEPYLRGGEGGFSTGLGLSSKIIIYINIFVFHNNYNIYYLKNDYVMKPTLYKVSHISYLKVKW